ncbi:SDR family NAD(P)-dependent oxidoreductase [Spirosoma oryzicola]|uniref:SDR family NAD(P)-dependent oxidoreductase n=1 Tax=Spirosoma oryzicola TaxID=2898794 RepID=UPI001E652D29|nr:SDR family NAD(P)-dependent oxidoreductase [Spirosoma oryzicola]UHG94057.1 SDR family NAD(P)-dependent oxidoreductase [Spirosoma oryzicola]
MNQPKTWFVTGTSKGIGFMLVKELLQAGHNVIATTRQPDTLLDALGGPHEHLLALPVDLSNEASVKSAVQQAIDRFGRLDIVINNAGYALLGSLEEVTDEEFRQSMDINLFGAINVIRAVIPPMRNQNSGHVINISSNAGYVGYGNAGAYNAAKFALIGISEALALETQPFGIKVTVVAPGQFRTNFMDKGSMQFAKNRIAAYELDKAEQLWNDFSGQQAGDPLKLVTILMELVNHPAPPLHLLLGPDTYELIQTHRQREKEEFDAWKTVSLSTNFD